MPRGYKKNCKASVVATKESRGGGSKRQRSGKRSRRRFSPKGGQQHYLTQEIKHDWQEIKHEQALELESLDDDSSSWTAISSTSSSSHSFPSCASAPRELCDVEDNFAPLCNKACCNPPIIQGLQQLLQEEPQQQPKQPAMSYCDIAMIPPVQDRYVFEDLQIVRTIDQRTREYNEYSVVELSFDYQPTSMTAFKREYPGYCSTCSAGAYSSYGYNGDYQDFELKVLPSLELAVSSRLKYKPFRIHLQHLITAVYDWKDTLYECNLDCSYPEWEGGYRSYWEGESLVRELNDKCEQTMQRIVWLLKSYISNEARAQAQLSFLSLAVYKCHLQQLAIEGDYGKEYLNKFLAGESGTLYVDWKGLQDVVPHNRLSSIGIIVQHVKPFLLDVREY